MATSEPLINGIRYSHSSIEIRINGKFKGGITSIAFDHDLAPGEILGTSAEVLGRTRGASKHSGNFELPLGNYVDLITELGDNYKEAHFDIVCNWDEAEETPIVHKLIGCRITKTAVSSAGSDATMVKCDLSIMRQTTNGLSPVSGL
jgi:hypothetical protein